MRYWLLCIALFPIFACAGMGVEATSVNAIKHQNAKIKTTVCVTDDDWLPYTFLSRTDKPALTGASIDAIDFLFKKMGEAYTLKPIIWTRLIRSEQEYIHLCDVIWDIPKNTAKELGVKISTPLYITRAVVLFDKKTFKHAEVEKFSFTTLFSRKAKLCGIRGNDYQVLTPFVDVRVKDTQQALDLIGKSRCTLFFSGVHVVKLGLKHNMYTLPSNLGYAILPKKNSTAYYVALTKSNQSSMKLLRKLNAVIKDAVDSGQWQKIYQKYGIQHNLESSITS